jgi:selenocysteine-specific elongation factor
MRVIGTAGHVDHGKSTLVQALTGTHPDRLKEEREREMTIDLGFAWFNLPGGEPVGIVDVPGHRDFIENMLAGIGGVDAVLLVVAADEGVRPQTREHLAILDLLHVDTGLVALTKADLVDNDWLALMTEEVEQALRGTSLAGAPIVPVSARTGRGLEELVQHLAHLLGARPARSDKGRPRLPVDRVFTIAGFGTVVTGTLLDGTLAVGDEIALLPGHQTARIRGLQTHRIKMEHAAPGSRVAANLAGVQVADIQRGDVVCLPDSLTPTELLDVQLRHLAGASAPLKHGSEVKLFVGASETLATARLLDTDVLLPGASGWVQLATRARVVVCKVDRFVVRRPSPGETIGGGIVVDPLPGRRHKRFDPDTLARLETTLKGTPDEILAQTLDAAGLGPLGDALSRTGLDSAAARAAIASLAGRGDLVALERTDPAWAPGGLVASRVALNRLTRAATELLAAYHAAHPLRPGLPREELKSRLKLSARAFNAFAAWAAARGGLAESGAWLKLPGHVIALNAEEQARVDRLTEVFDRDPHNTPSLKDSVALVGEEVLAVLIDRGEVVQVSPEVLFLRATYDAMVAAVAQRLRAQPALTVAQVRDMFGTSRKYALALMEHLDTIGLTVRKGDERILKA